MKNSKLFIVLLAALSCFSAFGQEQYENTWFGGVGAGMNFGVDRLNYVHSDRENSHRGAGTAIDAWFGKRVNDWFGLRIGYQGLNISNAFVEYGRYPYHHIHADAMLMKNRFIMPYAHLGLAKLNKPTAAGGIGVMVPIHLSKLISIVPDLKITAFSDKAWNSNRLMAANISGTVGLAINLARPRACKPVEEIEYVMPEAPKVDTVIVHQIDTVIVHQIDTVTVLEEISQKFTEQIAGVVLFDFDRSDIRSEEAFAVLKEIADWMIENPERSILIEGYTDQRGTDAYNLGLSQRRADTIREQLIAAGVEPERITAVGHGKGNFNIGNDAEEIHQQNRRTVITVK